MLLLFPPRCPGFSLRGCRWLFYSAGTYRLGRDGGGANGKVIPTYDSESGLGIRKGLILCVTNLVFEGGDLHDIRMRRFRVGMDLLT